MIKFEGTHNIIDLVEANYHLLPVLNRLGIFLGNKDKTLKSICEEANVDLDFLLLIINTFNDEDYFPESEWNLYSPLMIIDYLSKTHQYYIEFLLPKLEHLLAQLIDSDQSEKSQLKIIEQFYLKYKSELMAHIKDEEEQVFPYIKKLVDGKLETSEYNIHTFEKEHSNVDIKLNDLKSLIIKYLPPDYDNNICNDFIINLFRFEKDIKDHARIEDKILIPQVLILEGR